MIRAARPLALGLFLAACATVPSGTAYRDTGQPLSVTTRNDTSRLAGNWIVRAATPDDAGPIAVAFRNGDGADSFAITRRVCAANTCEARRTTYTAPRLGPNRWRLAAPDAPTEIWVVWVDEGYRTAAFGTPDGSFGWILDRAATGGTDRLRAAREILEFNGYRPGAIAMRHTGDDT